MARGSQSARIESRPADLDAQHAEVGELGAVAAHREIRAVFAHEPRIIDRPCERDGRVSLDVIPRAGADHSVSVRTCHGLPGLVLEHESRLSAAMTAHDRGHVNRPALVLVEARIYGEASAGCSCKIEL